VTSKMLLCSNSPGTWRNSGNCVLESKYGPKHVWILLKNITIHRTFHGLFPEHETILASVSRTIWVLLLLQTGSCAVEPFFLEGVCVACSHAPSEEKSDDSKDSFMRIRVGFQ